MNKTLHRSPEEDLLYVHKHSSRRTWHVFRFIPSKCKEIAATSTSDGRPASEHEFSQCISSELDIYLNVSVVCTCIDSAFWLRLAVQGESSNIIYAVHYPHTELVMFAGLKSAYREYILQAFMTVLRANKVEQLELKGHQVAALAQLALFRFNQVQFPCTTASSDQIEHTDSDDFDCKLISENSDMRSECRDLLQKHFGPNPLPALDTLDYKLETNFYGRGINPTLSQQNGPFLCRVRLEGENVLEGIRNLASAGLATLPLRAHLRKVHTMARSTIVLRNKTCA